jgi:glycosyltransferase involved in cell wall biosynthesis
MKHKILIVNKSFAVGGIQTSLINMLKELNDYFEIDLLVFHNEGPLKDKVPPGVSIIKPSMLVSTLGMSLKDLKKCRNPIKVLFRLFATVWTKLFSNSLPIWIALSTQKKFRGYDLAIAFHHETRSKTVVSGFSRFIIKCVDARRKISWMHADPIKAGLDSNKYYMIYRQLDKIVCVSKSSMISFNTCFPNLIEKSDYCYNFNPYNEILEKSNEQTYMFNKVNGELLLFSASRLSTEKGLIRGVRAISALINEGYKVKWYIAGEGPEKEKIIEEINYLSLNEHITLLGLISNPYPYMKEADLLLVSSYHEAAPMVIDEAKIVGVPVFSTDIPVIKEKVTTKTGYICVNSEEGIYEGLKEIFNNQDLLVQMRKELSKSKYSNLESFNFFNRLLNDE